MIRITEHLFKIEDTCSVYAVVSHSATLLIDCGTHVTPQRIAELGLPPVERLLLTHFHRDQCSAARLYQAAGTVVTAPFAERRFFEEADLLKASYDTYDNYTSYYQTFTALENIPIDIPAYDYDRLDWHDLRIEVLPVPGHTFGSVAYKFRCDEKTVIACGDVISAPGKMHQYFWTQWQYMEFKGHVNHLESLKAIAEQNADLLLPGHGNPIASCSEAIDSLLRPLEDLYKLFHGSEYTYFRPEFRRISEHVIEVSNAVAHSYIIHDDSGHAVMIDSGYVSNAMIAANPHRYIDGLTPHLLPELGIRNVEWFLPSHYHDDHLAGYHALQFKYGTALVSSTELVDILEHPENYDMPCTLPLPLRVTKNVNRGDAFHWRGIDFFIEQHPGQTWYHHLIRFEVDGKRYLCIGDNISGKSFRENRDHIHSFIPKNRTPVTSYGDMPRQILDADPDIILTGHGGAVPHDRDQTHRWQDWMNSWQTQFTNIIDQSNPNLGMDPHWVRFSPFKVMITPGKKVCYTVTVTNHEIESRSCRIRFRSVEGVLVTPEEIVIEIDGGATSRTELLAQYPMEFKTHSLPILADVTWGEDSLGEIAEAIAYW